MPIPFKPLFIATLCLSWQISQAQPDNNAPVPRNAEGRVLLQGETPAQKGVWVPQAPLGYPVGMLGEIPFKPWAKGLYDARQRHELEPHSRCKASGAARQFITPYGVEILEVAPIQKLYIFDIGGPHTYKTVHMDGRAHPDDLELSNYGHSVGWWEGDTLVIDTVGYNEDFWFERRGLPHTDKLRTIERLTRVDAGTMRYEITVDDPDAYEAPFTGGFNLFWREGVELFEFICQQANYAHELMVGQERDSVDRSSPIIP